MFSLSVLDWKYQFWLNLTSPKIVCLEWKVVPTEYLEDAELGGMFTFPFSDWKTPIWGNLVQNIKIVC